MLRSILLRSFLWVVPLGLALLGLALGVYRPCMQQVFEGDILSPAPGRGCVLFAVGLLGYAAVLWQFDVGVRLLSPATSLLSKRLYVVLLLGFSPALVQVAWWQAGAGVSTALALTALVQLLWVVEYRRRASLLYAVAAGLAAVAMQPDVWGLLLPLGAWAVLLEWQRGRHLWAATCIGLTAAGAGTVWWWVLSALPCPVWPVHWSESHLFQGNFSMPAGAGSGGWPNLLLMVYPLGHPAFYLLMGGLFLLAKRTDVYRPVQRLLVAGWVCYGVWLACLPKQFLPDVLPMYCLCLWLLFPAWDRLVMYGGHFFPRLTWGLVWLTVGIQLLSNVYFFVSR